LVLFGNPDAVHRWRGAPLRHDFRARYGIRPILSLPVPSESVEGRLFILDRQGLTSDDLTIGHVVADHVATCLDQFDLLRRLEETVARGERSRVARDLHDGVLQTLAGTAMQLQEVRYLLEQNPPAARERLQQIQSGIEEEQRQLRIFIMRLKPSALPPRQVEIGLARLLEQLAIRLKEQWGLEVRWTVARPQERISTVLWHELNQMICEGAANAKRHGQASHIDIAVDVQASQVCLSIANDGRPFPFRGHLDLAALAKRNLGPTTLRERIMALGGDLAIDSRAGGAKLEIRLPLLMEGVAHAD
jgi:signal transduction histidine kinase